MMNAMIACWLLCIAEHYQDVLSGILGAVIFLLKAERKLSAARPLYVQSPLSMIGGK